MADPEADTEILDDEPKSIILEMIKQLRYGMDLHKVTFPTFVLEPRSMLERITDFMAHPELIIKASELEDPVERFVGVVRYFLAGWHVRPKGVKKPYNPVLGEYFRCRWNFEDGSRGFYIAEQVSHHPPISAFFYACPEHHIIINGHIAPKSKFLGNSVASILEGNFRICFTNRPGEEYVVNPPNLYARGILFGTMVYEVSDLCKVTCEANDLSAEIEFKSKGYFTGTYNALTGTIKNSREALHKLSGKWSDEIYIQSTKAKKQDVLFDAANATVFKKIVPAEAEQTQFESRMLWTDVTKAIQSNNQQAATDAKTIIEDAQRKAKAEREEKNEEWVPKHFRKEEDGDNWVCVYSKSSFDPTEYAKELQEVLFDKFDPKLSS